MFTIYYLKKYKIKNNDINNISSNTITQSKYDRVGIFYGKQQL